MVLYDTAVHELLRSSYFISNILVNACPNIPLYIHQPFFETKQHSLNIDISLLETRTQK